MIVITAAINNPVIFLELSAESQHVSISEVALPSAHHWVGEQGLSPLPHSTELRSYTLLKTVF